MANTDDYLIITGNAPLHKLCRLYKHHGRPCVSS